MRHHYLFIEDHEIGFVFTRFEVISDFDIPLKGKKHEREAHQKCNTRKQKLGNAQFLKENSVKYGSHSGYS